MVCQQHKWVSDFQYQEDWKIKQWCQLFAPLNLRGNPDCFWVQNNAWCEEFWVEKNSLLSATNHSFHLGMCSKFRLSSVGNLSWQPLHQSALCFANFWGLGILIEIAVLKEGGFWMFCSCEVSKLLGWQEMNAPSILVTFFTIGSDSKLL